MVIDGLGSTKGLGSHSGYDSHRGVVITQRRISAVALDKPYFLIATLLRS